MTDQLAGYFDQILAARKSPDILNRLDKSGNGLVRHFLNHCISNAPISSAQLFQDLFVVFVTREKRDGFFVEFGATNGRSLSNTYLLEQEFGWTGILAEPAKSWHFALKKNRKAAIDSRCVWKASGQIINFEETRDSMFSGAAETARENSSSHGSIKYPVETISLNDLLLAHHAPRKIDYLSIDTEGSEYKILRAFDFKKYDVGIITVEHGYSKDRPKIQSLLERAGFFNVFQAFSKWDDWYLNGSVYPR